MTDYTGRFETTQRASLTDDQIDELIEQLSEHHPALSELGGRLTVTISYPAESLRQAMVTGEAVVTRALTCVGLRAEVSSAEVMTTADFDRRLGFASIPELLSVTEAAAVMGVSGARVRQLLDEGKLKGTKIGATWAVSRAAAEARVPLAD